MRYQTFGASETSSREAGFSALVLPDYIHARQFLKPRMNQARDAQLAEDSQAGTRYSRLHRLSVLINGLQWPVALAAMALVKS